LPWWFIKILEISQTQKNSSERARLNEGSSFLKLKKKKNDLFLLGNRVLSAKNIFLDPVNNTRGEPIE
jgi:hypothetical protein